MAASFVAVVPQPDPGVLGAFELSAESGIIGAGLVVASGILFSFRWADATRLALIRRVRIAVANAGTAFAAATLPSALVLVPCRAFTASDTGGTAVTPSGNGNKKRTSFGSSLAADLRIASATLLVAGTRTPDANPLTSSGYFTTNTTAGGVQLAKTDLLVPDVASGEYPLVLAQNEGFEIQNGANALPGTGTTKVSVEVEWSEVSLY